MIVGVIQTKDVFLHPLTIIEMRGIRGYFRILKRALSTKPYAFINMFQNSAMLKTLKKVPRACPTPSHSLEN